MKTLRLKNKLKKKTSEQLVVHSIKTGTYQVTPRSNLLQRKTTGDALIFATPFRIRLHTRLFNNGDGVDRVGPSIMNSAFVVERNVPVDHQNFLHLAVKFRITIFQLVANLVRDALSTQR